MGQTDLALQSLEEAERLSGGNSKPCQRGAISCQSGKDERGALVLEQLMTRSGEGYVPLYALALSTPVSATVIWRTPRSTLRMPRATCTSFPDRRSEVG